MKKGSKTSSFGTTSRIAHDASKYYDSKLYSQLDGNATDTDAPMPDNPLPVECENVVIHGSEEQMKELPDNCLHLMITSPPYNASKEYDEDLSLADYLALLERVF